MKTGFVATGAFVYLASTAIPVSAQQAASQLPQAAAFDHQVSGVTVSEDGRIFVNFPRWTEDAAVSVAELKDGKVVAYPDDEWNAWRNAKKDEIDSKNHWVCVQSLVADHAGNIWVLDPAAPGMGANIADGSKLVEIDLKTNKPARVIAFDEDVAPQGSYLNDVRFSPDGKTAYLTDSGAVHALIVLDLTMARRVAAGWRCLDDAGQERHQPITASHFAVPTVGALNSPPTASRCRAMEKRCIGKRSRARCSTVS